MSLFFEEIKKSRVIYITAIIISAIFIIIYLSFYPLYVKNIDTIYQIVYQMLPELRDYFNISLIGLETVTNYYSFVFKFVSIFIAVISLWGGIRVLSLDKEEEKTTFYFIKPISRDKILLIKLGANLLWLTSGFLVYHAISFLMMIYLNRHDLSGLILLQINSSLYFIATIFSLIGVVIGAYLKSSRYALPISILTVFIFTVISIINHSFTIYFLEYLNPLSYFKITDILETGQYQYHFIVITVFLLFFLYQYVNALYTHEEIGGDSLD